MLTWFSGTDTHPPALLRLRSSKTFIILTVTTATFTDLFIYGLVVPVLPFALETRVRINPSDIQRWISIFLAVYGGALLFAAPICGWAADRVSSRRGPMLSGLVALVGSTAMLCVGRSIAVLVVGRVLQGVSAAIVWGVGLALLVDTMGTQSIGLAMGYVGLGMSLALLVAPLLGGIVFAKAGYYAVFAMAFGLIILDIILRLVMVERKIAAKWLPAIAKDSKERDDVGPSQTTATEDVEINHSTGEEKHESHTAIEAYDDILDTQCEKSTKSPSAPGPVGTERPHIQLPPIILLLASRRLLSALWCCTAQTVVFTVMDTILPLFVSKTFHWNSIGAGLIFLPIVLGSFLNPVIGYFCDKYGPRWFATVGSVVACPTLILLRLVHNDTLQQKVLLCALLAIMGICLNLVMTPMIAEITYAIEEKERRRPPGFFGEYGAYAQAYSLFNVAWSAGGLVGPLLGGLTNETKGWGASTLLLGCICIFTAIPAAIWTGGSIFKKTRSRVGAKEMF